MPHTARLRPLVLDALAVGLAVGLVVDVSAPAVAGSQPQPAIRGYLADSSLALLRPLIGRWRPLVVYNTATPPAGTTIVAEDYQWVAGAHAIHYRENYVLPFADSAVVDGLIYWNPATERVEFRGVSGAGPGHLYTGEYRMLADGRLEREFDAFYRTPDDVPGDEFGGLRRRFRQRFTFFSADSVGYTLDWFHGGSWRPFGGQFSSNTLVRLRASPPARRESSPQTRPTVLPRVGEVDLALSAAPDHLRAGAGVYALEAHGFVRVRATSNGFTCIVNRDAPLAIKPVCYDAEGAATILPKVLRVGEMLMAGKSEREIDAMIEAGFKDGTFISPRRPGVAYMLSDRIVSADWATGATSGFPPHIMFYAPGLNNADIGARPDVVRMHPGLPFIGFQGPHGFMIVVPDRSTLPRC